jgi:hypothetical protein
MPNIVVGLLAFSFGLWGLSVWWWSVTELMRGLLPLLSLLFGVVALAAGISTVRKEGEGLDSRTDVDLSLDDVESELSDKDIMQQKDK